MNQNLELQLDLAKLDLKGKRYEDAEKKYLIIIEQYPTTSFAWCGLGIAKYRHLLDANSTVDEVFFCFEKAKTIDTENQVELFVLENSYEVIKSLYEMYLEAIGTGEEARKQKRDSMLTFVVSSVIGSTSKNKSLYTDFVGIGGNVLAYSDFNKAHYVQLSAEDRMLKVFNLLKEIKAHVVEFIKDEKEKLNELETSIVKIENEIQYGNKIEDKQRLDDPAISKEKQKRKLLIDSKSWQNMFLLFFFGGLCSICLGFFQTDEDEKGQLISIGITCVFISIFFKIKNNKIKKKIEEIDYQE